MCVCVRLCFRFGFSFAFASSLSSENYAHLVSRLTSLTASGRTWRMCDMITKCLLSVCLPCACFCMCVGWQMLKPVLNAIYGKTLLIVKVRLDDEFWGDDILIKTCQYS